MFWIESIRNLLALPGCTNPGVRLLVFMLILHLGHPNPSSAHEVDRLIASVNGVAITNGDLNLARSLNAIIFVGKTAEADSRDQEIERQINQELMRQELKNFSLPDEADKVEARMQSLRNAYALKGGLPALLLRIGMQESELISYIQLELEIMRFVDFRFRPFITVSTEEVQAYYRDKLMAQLQKSGIELPPLIHVSNKIETILREEKINDALDQWIKEVRRNSRIEFFDETD
jgi:hypothetical protein